MTSLISVSKPELGMSAAFGDVVDEEGHDQHDDRAEPCRNKHIPVTDSVDAVSPDYGNQGRGAARRMKGW
jgi:hypothetical protein